jgi:hypothetical protein
LEIRKKVTFNKWISALTAASVMCAKGVTIDADAPTPRPHLAEVAGATCSHSNRENAMQHCATRRQVVFLFQQEAQRAGGGTQ